MAKLREAAMKDGLPRRSYAYAPTADPSTWKLPYLTADGKPDPDHLPGAAAALSEGGYRGERADIPAADAKAVKARLRQAYRRWKGTDVQYPAGIAEADEAMDRIVDGIDLREAAVLVPTSGVSGVTVIECPSCHDTLIVPPWTGAFDPPAAPLPMPEDPIWDAQDVLYAIKPLVRRRKAMGDNADEAAEAAAIDKAIAALKKLAQLDVDEIGQADEPAAMTESEWDAALADLREAGKRNSGADQKRIQAAHDLMHDLGAVHEEKVQESIAYTGDAAAVSFREASGSGLMPVTLAEADPQFDDATRTVRIIPIRPGPGNSRDRLYYPQTTLQEATVAGLFTGKKMYADHPRKSDEKDLPERSVKDWVATIQEAVWDEARGVPRATVKVHEADVYQKWKDAPEQIAFSIRGGGMARPGKVNGQDLRIVESIKSVGSVDWVTNAGAGGAIDFSESAADEGDSDMDLSKLTADELREARPDLVEALAAPAAPAGNNGVVLTEAEAETFRAFLAREAETNAKAAAETALREAKASAKSIVDAVIAESTEPKIVKDEVLASFAEATMGTGYLYTDEPGLRGAVTAELARFGKFAALIPSKTPTGLGGIARSEDGEVSPLREARAALDARWGSEDIPKAPRTTWTADELAGVVTSVAEAAPTDGVKAISESGDEAPASLSEAGKKAFSEMAGLLAR